MSISPEQARNIEIPEYYLEKTASKTKDFVEQLFSNNVPENLSSRISLIKSSIVCNNEKFTEILKSSNNSDVQINLTSGFYDPNTDLIYLKEDFKNDENSLIHEILHFISVKPCSNDKEKHKSGFRINYKNGLVVNDRLNEATTVFLSAFISSNISTRELSEFNKYFDLVRNDVFNQIKDERFLSKSYKKYVEKLTNIFDFRWELFFDEKEKSQKIKFFQSYFNSDIYKFSAQANENKNVYVKQSFFKEFILHFDDIDENEIIAYKNLITYFRSPKSRLTNKKYVDRHCIKYYDNYLKLLNDKNLSYQFVWPDMLDRDAAIEKVENDKYTLFINSRILLDIQNLSKESSFSFKNNILFAIRAGLLIKNFKKGKIISYESTLNDENIKKTIEKLRFFN